MFCFNFPGLNPIKLAPKINLPAGMTPFLTVVPILVARAWGPPFVRSLTLASEL